MLNRCQLIFLLTFADMWYNVYSEDAKLFVSCWLHYILYRKQDFELFTWHLSITLISCWKKSKDWFLKFLLEISMFFLQLKHRNWEKLLQFPPSSQFHIREASLIWWSLDSKTSFSICFLCFVFSMGMLPVVHYWILSEVRYCSPKMVFNALDKGKQLWFKPIVHVLKSFLSSHLNPYDNLSISWYLFWLDIRIVFFCVQQNICLFWVK